MSRMYSVKCATIAFLWGNSFFLFLQVQIGQMIGVTLDMDSRTLSFDVEGKYLGIALSLFLSLLSLYDILMIPVAWMCTVGAIVRKSIVQV